MIAQTPDPIGSGGVILSAADRWLPSLETRGSKFQLAIPAAVAMHLAALAVLLPMRETVIGDPSLTPESVTVELLDAKEFDRRSQATLDPGKDQVTSQVAPAPSAAQSEQQQQQPAKESASVKEPSQQAPEAVPKPAANETKSLVDALATPLTSSFQVPGKLGLDLAVKLPPVGTPMPRGAKAGERQVSAAETYIDRRSRGQRSAAGIADEFTRTILRILQQSRPISNGMMGRLVVGFGVTEAGFMEGLHLVESSGQQQLDKMVLDALRQVELVTPPAGATLRDRTFEVTYIYDRTSGKVGF